MYNDIDELTKEVEDFRTRINDSGKACDLLAEISKHIDTQLNSLNEKHLLYVENIRTTGETLDNSIQVMLADISCRFDAQQSTFIEKLSTYIATIKAAEDVLDKQIDGKLQAVVNEIKNVNKRFVLLFGGVGIAILVAIVGLFL